MSKFIIAVGGRPLIYGYHRQEFKWSEGYRKFIFLGREIDEAEFNEQVEKALERYRDLNPKVILVASAPAAEVPPPAPPVAPPPVPVATISAEEITLEMAEEVIKRLAPDRLKKKPGVKAASAA